MRILGLTGSIGMGKSVAAGVLRRLGVPVHDSDAAVHCAIGAGGAAVDAVGRAFPGVARNGVIDRRALGDRVFGDPEALRRLEAILHPLVRSAADRMLATAARRRAPIVALDIPLLYETGAAARCDAVAVVSAPAFLQAQRVLRRKGMTPARLAQILARQVPDAQKRQRADFIVSTGLGRERSLRALKRALRTLRRRPGRAWRPGYTRLN
ncbi:MAG TPA: dephospho-CoA kinase [Alphaproteobacteria bacterium]|jgi:dephospho-CoA kinase|nr:dephospho-CoA kinase [Alphaproteobacteria bacterium]